MIHVFEVITPSVFSHIQDYCICKCTHFLGLGRHVSSYSFSPALPPQGDCRPEARKQEHCRLHPQVGKRPRTSVRQQRQEQQQQDDISRYKPPHGSSLSNHPLSFRLFFPHFDGVLFLVQVQFANLITKACYPIFPIQTNSGPFVPSDLLQVRLRQGIL